MCKAKRFLGNLLQRGREAQRCQVTPYVVNVLLVLLLVVVVEGAIAKYNFSSLLNPS